MPNKLEILGPVRQVYDEQVLSGIIEPDHAQIELVGHLDDLIRNITTNRLAAKSSSLGWLFAKKVAETPNRQGLYIWGGVGRGKSYLMDMFFSVANIEPKRRIHFNNFMQQAHQLIHDQRQKFKQGKSKQQDPVRAVGKYSPIAQNYCASMNFPFQTLPMPCYWAVCLKYCLMKEWWWWSHPI